MTVQQPKAGPAGDIQPAIQIRGLSHAYLRGTPLESSALADVNLEVGGASVVGLIGPTGSGKSTLMQHLNGLIRPQSGQVIVEGIDWSDPVVDAWAARQRIGLLFQQAEDQLFEQFVGDDVAYGPRQMKLDKAEVRQRVRTAMDAVGLPFEDYKDRLCQSLSGGEQRRAALAGVLALQPEMLVTDEPTAGLDPRGRSEIIAILRQAHQHGADLVIGSHRMEDIAALCDQVVELRDGRVAASGETRHVLCRAGEMYGQTPPMHPVSAIAAGLRAAGWPIPPDVISIDELQEAIDGARIRSTGSVNS